ncbi:MAG: homoserine kinase [Hyphomicrobiales bacterium]
MAVYTEVSDEELAEFVAGYSIGDVVSFKGIAEGVENSNYLLRTTQGNFILTLYEKRVAPEDLPFFLSLMEHLADKDIPCPLPVHDTAGEVLSTLAGRPAAIITFLDGMWIRRPQVHHCSQLGKALAHFHLASADFKMKRANALLAPSWRTLIDNCGSGADDIEFGLRVELRHEVDVIAEHWPKQLPSGVIHADLFPDNVFFLKNELSGLIDFYFACTDYFAYDVAICMNAWCFEVDGAFNITKAGALLRAYQAVRPLTAAEYISLPLLARGAAMRFLATRLYDWINTPEGALVKPKDPREYLNILRFHRSVFSATEYGLDHEDAG